DRDDEVEAGEDGGKPCDEYTEGGGYDVGVRVDAAVGRVESPPRIDAARDNRREGKQASGDEDIPAQKVDLGKGKVAGCDHHRHQKVSKHGRYGGQQEKENHDHAVHGEELVVGLRLHEVALGCEQLDAHQHGKKAADEEEERDGCQVE